MSPSSHELEKLGTSVRSEVQRYGLDLPIQLLRDRLPADATMYLVGGFIRDVVRSLMGEHDIRVKDADILVDTSRLEHAVADVGGTVSRTCLGGYRWHPARITAWIDAWQLKDTIWIQKLRLAPTIDTFLDGVDLNIDRIAVNLRNDTVIDRGCYRAVSSRLIELDAKYHLPELEPDELARAVLVHFKTGYRLSFEIIRSIERSNIQLLLKRAADRLLGDDCPRPMVRQVLNFIKTVGKESSTQSRRGKNNVSGGSR